MATTSCSSVLRISRSLSRASSTSLSRPSVLSAAARSTLSPILRWSTMTPLSLRACDRVRRRLQPHVNREDTTPLSSVSVLR